MKRISVVAALICLVVFVYGCQPPADPADDGTETSDAKQSTLSTSDNDPRAVESVEQFLHALSAGNTEIATAMLSEKARIENEKAGMGIDPPGSPTAKYTVSPDAWFDPDQPYAQVSSTWTDRDSRDVVQTYEIVWLLKKEKGDWKITGMGTKVFADQPPIVLNFENPQQMQLEREKAMKQVAERAQQNSSKRVAKQDEDDTLRR